tara:strand:- start:766 stop:1050 length:285 start_codon:yes stop_codon:yes gene_type:complete
MIVKTLGILDIVVGVVFWIGMILNIQALYGFIMLLGLILLVKGIVFAFNLNVVSVLDIISSFIIIYASSNELSNLIVIVVSIFLLQKGIFSMLS